MICRSGIETRKCVNNLNRRTKMIGVLGVIFVIICVASAFMEGKTTGLYKYIGVYGRLRAYLLVDFIFAGCAMILRAFIPGLAGAADNTLAGTAGSVLLGIALIALSVWLYLSARAKCPMQYQGKLLPSMLISGLGVTAKICVFFLPFVWELSVPRGENF